MCSIATLNAREKDGQGPWKIAVAYHTSDNKPFATKLLEFEVTMDILNGKSNYQTSAQLTMSAMHYRNWQYGYSFIVRLKP